MSAFVSAVMRPVRAACEPICTVGCRSDEVREKEFAVVVPLHVSGIADVYVRRLLY